MLCDVFIRLGAGAPSYYMPKLRSDRMLTRDFRDRVSSMRDVVESWKYQSFVDEKVKIPIGTDAKKTLFIRCIIYGAIIKGGYYYRCTFIRTGRIENAIFIGPCMSTARNEVIRSGVNGCSVLFSGVTIESLSETPMDKALNYRSKLCRMVHNSDDPAKYFSIYMERANAHLRRLSTYNPSGLSIDCMVSERLRIMRDRQAKLRAGVACIVMGIGIIDELHTYSKII